MRQVSEASVNVCYHSMDSYYVFSFRSSAFTYNKLEHFLKDYGVTTHKRRIGGVRDFVPKYRVRDTRLHRTLGDAVKYYIDLRKWLQREFIRFSVPFENLDDFIDWEYERLITFSPQDGAMRDVSCFIALFSDRYDAVLLVDGDERKREGVGAAIEFKNYLKKRGWWK